MASTAIISENAQKIFDEIDNQFRLSTETLVELTKAFAAETQDGLENYGRAMAIM